MITDTQVAAFEQKLALIEKDIEEENERANTNRMKARFFMFFLLFGADSETRFVLERKVRDLLRNPDACEFLEISTEGAVEDYGKQVEDAILHASHRHVDVQNLNTFYVCPVLFSKDQNADNLSTVLLRIDEYIQHSGRMPIWQPFVVINRSVSQYANIYSAISTVCEFVRDGREGSINRCCLLSDQDGNGFTVPQENIMQTIAMTVVLQNVESQNAGAAHSIHARVQIPTTSKGAEDIFFTARNAAVTNPIRSLTLQRMQSAIDYFSGKTDEMSEKTLGRIQYSFVGEIMRPYYNKLPLLDGCISFFPLYSVGGRNSQELQRLLNETIRKLYFEPLQGDIAKEEQLRKAKEEFLRRYFMESGSLSGLYDLVSSQRLEMLFLQYAQNAVGVIPIEAPLPNKKKLQMFNEGVYKQAHDYCEQKVVRQAGLELLKKLGEYLSSADMLSAISNAQEHLKQMKDCISDRLRKLQDVETVLVLDQTVQRTEYDQVQSRWIADRAGENPAVYQKYNKRFDGMIYELVRHAPEDSSELLSVCYDAVKGSGYSNIEYLKHVSDDCAANDDRAQEFANIVEKSWCYTLRFLKHEESKDVTCVIGDPTNCFCEVLCERFNGTLFEFKGFDRIDVLHISDPFAPANVWEWEQILKKRG